MQQNIFQPDKGVKYSKHPQTPHTHHHQQLPPHTGHMNPLPVRVHIKLWSDHAHNACGQVIIYSESPAVNHGCGPSFGWVWGTEESGRAEMSPQQQATTAGMSAEGLSHCARWLVRRPHSPSPAAVLLSVLFTHPLQARISYALFGDEVRSVRFKRSR